MPKAEISAKRKAADLQLKASGAWSLKSTGPELGSRGMPPAEPGN